MCFQNIPKRVILGLQMFLCCFVDYIMRTCLNFQIISMTKAKPFPNGTVPEQPNYGPRFDWTERIQGDVIGAYYYGYLITSLCAGWLAENFNTITLITGMTAVESILFSITPLVAHIHYGYVMAVRMGCGLCGGIMLPSLHTLISKWAPSDERGKFVCMLLGGGAGNLFTWYFLAKVIPLIGWKSPCYILSTICLVWAITFYFSCYPSPKEHPTITSKENEYIQNSIRGLKIHSGVKVHPPIGQIVINIHFIALFILHFGNAWGLFFILTEAPKFISEGLHLNSKQSGLVAGLPGIGRLLGGMFFAILGDIIYRKAFVSLMNFRRFFVIFSHILPGVCLVGATYSSFEYKSLTIMLLAFSLASNGAVIHTNNVNNQDLAPNFAGSLYGYANVGSSIAGIIGPKLVGQFLSGKGGNTLVNWRKAFFMGASVYWLTAVVWMILGSTDIQDFNYQQIGKPKISLTSDRQSAVVEKDPEKPEVSETEEGRKKWFGLF